MTQYTAIHVTVDDRGVASLELAAPEKRNALSAAMIAEITDFATTLPTDGSIRVVVLSGQGSMFCAGGDLAWMKEQINADRAQRMREGRKLANMLRVLNELPVPLIGRVHGGAFGGGIGLCCVCDLVVADEETKFGLTETKLGLIPATISPYVIARMSEGKAREVFMSSRIFGAERAQSLNIVTQIVPASEMDAAIAHEVEPYLHTAPNAVAASKALARALGPRIDDAVIEDTIRRLADTWEGKEAAHGIDAFLTKTKARWA